MQKSDIAVVIKYEFIRGTSALDTARRINDVCKCNYITEQTVRIWFLKFKSGDFDLNNDPKVSYKNSNYLRNMNSIDLKNEFMSDKYKPSFFSTSYEKLYTGSGKVDIRETTISVVSSNGSAPGPAPGPAPSQMGGKKMPQEGANAQQGRTPYNRPTYNGTPHNGTPHNKTPYQAVNINVSNFPQGRNSHNVETSGPPESRAIFVQKQMHKTNTTENVSSVIITEE